MADFSCAFCHLTDNDIEKIIHHGIERHGDKDIKVRRKIFSENHGGFVNQSLYFRSSSITTFSSLKKKVNEGFKYIVDLDVKLIRFKRVQGDDLCSHECKGTEENTVQANDTDDIEDQCSHDSKDTEGNTVQSHDTDDIDFDHEINDVKTEELKKTVTNVLRVISETGRGGDFISVLKAIECGTLPVENLGLQLFLDIGKFLQAPTINRVRYSKVSLDFWTLVHKMFKGKATRLFRGIMTQDAGSEAGT